MGDDIVALLRLFEDVVPDYETNAWVISLATDRARWRDAHRIFMQVRGRNLAAIEAGDRIRQCQYCFEENCLKSLYNGTNPPDPFDPDSPFWVAKCAFILAHEVGISAHAVASVFAP